MLRVVDLLLVIILTQRGVLGLQATVSIPMLRVIVLKHMVKRHTLRVALQEHSAIIHTLKVLAL